MRRQSIISTFLMFVGFGVGFVNTYFFTKTDWFTTEQYGLTRSFFDFGSIIFAFCFLGFTVIIYKFFPYYKANLNAKQNDLISWALFYSTISFLIFLFIGYYYKNFFERKFSAKSIFLVRYYYWIFLFGYSLLIFNILESYCWSLKRTILTNFLKETALRLIISCLIFLFITKIINFDLFVKLFASIYLLLDVVLIVYLRKEKELYFTFTQSIVTKKFRKKMVVFGSFVFVGVLISTVAASFDSITISSKIGQKAIGVFAFSTYISNIIQIPQRSIISISIPFLSEAWRNKDYGKIAELYKRSSINLLLVSLLLFGGIWLSFEEVIGVFNLNKDYLLGKYVVLLFGLKLIIDMGTGLNGQIIGTSNHWRFEFFTGIALFVLIVPLNLLLITKIGITGAAISNLIAYAVYNIIRLIFLWKKYKMQPFSLNSLLALLVAVGAYFVVYFATVSLLGWAAIIVRSISFAGLFLGATYLLNLSPDIKPVIATIKKRLKLN